MALLAARFLVHVFIDDLGYQAKFMSRVDLTPGRLCENAIVQLMAMSRYFECPDSWRWRGMLVAAVVGSLLVGWGMTWVMRRMLTGSAIRALGLLVAMLIVAGGFLIAIAPWSPPSPMPGAAWMAGAAAAGIFAVAGVLTVAGQGVGPDISRSLLGVFVAIIAVVCGLAPYVIIEGTFRTQFLAGAAQAALLAFAISSVTTLLPCRWRTSIAILATSWLVGATTVAAWNNQENNRHDLAASFEKTVDVVHQVSSLAPSFKPGTLLLFLVEAHAESPFGSGYALEWISYELFSGGFAVQATIDAGAPPDLANAGSMTFSSAGVRVKSWSRGELLYAYEQAIVFRLNRTGEVKLLIEIPESLLPAGVKPNGYAPLARMQPGTIRQAPYYQYPCWTHRPYDIFDHHAGILLGDNWSDLRFRDGKLWRPAWDGAEIFINPAGRTRHTLTFLLDPGHAPQPCVMEAVDDTGRVVASAPANRGLVELSLPLQADRIQRFRLRLHANQEDGPHLFRIGRPGADVAYHPKYPRAPANEESIFGIDVRLTGSWYPLEKYGGKTFRWVENDAGLELNTWGCAATLLLDVEPGPGVSGQPGELTVFDNGGRVLASRALAGREQLRIPLPASAEKQLKVRLHIGNGGQRIPQDPRILNFRVFRAELCEDSAREDACLLQKAQ
jgi:hypothetical protein